MKHQKKAEFQKIKGVKKLVRCICCGKRVVVQNFNQLKCGKCGYRGVSNKSAVKTTA